MCRSEARARGVARAVIAFAVAAATGGCSSLPGIRPPASAGGAPAAPSVESPAPAGRDWSGRFSVNLQAPEPGGRNELVVGRFALSERPVPGGRRLEIEVVTPFGQTVARGRRQPDGASTLALADGRTGPDGAPATMPAGAAVVWRWRCSWRCCC